MPSKDTVNVATTKRSKEQLENIRKSISKELGVDIKNITLKHADIARRIKADRGKLLLKELQDIILGKTK